MNLGDLRTQFEQLLDRDDCSDALAHTFLGQAMQRIQRDATLPSMERMLVIQPTEPLSFIGVPPDLIQVKDIFVQDSLGNDLGLDLKSYRALQRIPVVALPTAYARYGATLQIRGSVPSGYRTTLWYYGEFSPVNTDTDENEIMASSPDVVIYAALSLAGDYFNHPQTQAFEARYQQYLTAIQSLADEVDREGGASMVSPAYRDPNGMFDPVWFLRDLKPI